MRVLLSDGSGITSRQSAGLLAAAGHEVEVLAATGLPLTRFTRHVAKVHRVPPFGSDPWGWWQAARQVVARRHPQVLLPTHDQVALLSLVQEELRFLGTGTAVPPFTVLARVQDTVSADGTLRAAGLARPPSWVASTPGMLVERLVGPAYLKAPIGTAGSGVTYVADGMQVREAADRLAAAGAFSDGGVLVESPVEGPLLMVQAVFDSGRLVALHANERSRVGVGGAASGKTSRSVDDLADDVARLGARLGWHGALSLDALVGPQGLVWIDVDPRLVEPVNAARSGVDLLTPLLALAERTPVPDPVLGGRPEVRTHQTLPAVLAAAGGPRPRRSVARELRQAAAHRGPYAGSVEELTPVRRDLRSAVPVLAVGAACLLRPRWSRRFSAGAVGGHALTPHAWRELRAAARLHPDAAHP